MNEHKSSAVGNSRADAWALLALVLIVTSCAWFWVNGQ